MIKYNNEKSEDLSSIVDSCLRRWEISDIDSTRDERITYFKENLPKWLDGLYDNEKSILKELLDNFEYYNDAKIRKAVKFLYNKLSKMNVKPDNSIYTKMNFQPNKTNSSHIFLYDYLTRVEDFNRKSIVDNIKEFKYLDNIKGIVVVDDINGTCASFKKFIEYIREFIVDKPITIYYMTVHSMEEAIEVISTLKIKYSLNIKHYYVYSSKKAFSCYMKDSRDMFSYISEKRGIQKHHIYGFNESESLIAFLHNTPDNTLGIFTWDSEDNAALFPRRIDKEPGFKKNKNINYLNKSK